MGDFIRGKRLRVILLFYKICLKFRTVKVIICTFENNLEIYDHGIIYHIKLWKKE